jgi:imidazolonepropionase-like amidohydrolase
VIDAGRLTILPGLIDAHVHLAIGGSVRDNARADVRAGFTTVADLGSLSHRMLRLRDSINTGAIEGPRVLAAGIWVGSKGGVCEFTGIGIRGGPDAFVQRVLDNVAAGADLTKVCLSSWPAAAFSSPQSVEVPEPTLKALVAASARMGRPVVAHAISRGSVQAALDAGVSGLAHVAYIDEPMARAMQQRGMWMIPTLASLTAGDSSEASRTLATSLRLARDAGVMLVFGTDGGVLPHGQGVEELRALVAAGLSPVAVLRAATVDAARAIGISDSVGVVAAGMSADFVGVVGDPLGDIGVLSEVPLVVSRGRVVKQPD